MSRDEFMQSLFDVWVTSRVDAKFVTPIDDVSPGVRAAWRAVAELALKTAWQVKSDTNAMQSSPFLK